MRISRQELTNNALGSLILLNIRTFLLGISLCIFLLPSISSAAVPSTISYQGYLADNTGVPVDGVVAITFNLYEAPTGGALLWSETLGIVNAVQGAFNVELGSISPVNSLPFDVPYYLGIQINGGPEMAPRQPLLSAPYAFKAADADTLGGVPSSQLDQSAHVGATNNPHSVTAAQTGADLAGSAATVQGSLDAHSGNASAHHAKYSDAEAVAAIKAADGAGSTLDADMVDGMHASDIIAASRPAVSCAGQNQALQWNGSQFVCINITSVGASVGNVNGFENRDNRGEVWDGIQRAQRTWDEANAACQAAGGRLPTVTELYRNNTTTTGTGNLSGPAETSYLWTSTPSYPANTYIQVRLSDGAVTSIGSASTAAYRCIWPDQVQTAFEGDACFGPVGAECSPKGVLWNVDTFDRPAMNYAAAVNECNASHASIMSIREAGEFIHAGATNGSNQWLWASDSINASVNTGYRWNGIGTSQHYYGSGGFTLGSTASYRVRCIGKKTASLGTLPLSPPCQNGNCFQVNGGKSRMIVDGEDRPPAPYSVAAETCRLAGASIPDAGEFAEMLHAGAPNGSNVFLWSNDLFSSRAYMAFRWGGNGTLDWLPASANTNAYYGDQPLFYRCIWHETIDSTPTVCATNEKQVWNGNGYACQPSLDGDSAGNATPVQLVDAWGNAWDMAERGPLTYTLAENACFSLGGRLPTPTEVYRVRGNQAIAPAIASAGNLIPVWTNIQDYIAGNRVTIQLGDGLTDTYSEASSRQFRCVWPAEKGDAFGSRSCSGDPASPCFQSGDLRMDAMDRASLSQSSAANECAFYGGRLPDADEFTELVHAGAPDGSSSWLWIHDPVYPSYEALGRWTGVGATSWQYNTLNGSYAWGYSKFPFRCVFSNRMD